MTQIVSPKQLEFIQNCKAKWNLAHGSVRSGKTVGTLFAFMNSLVKCPDSQIWMIGKTSETIYDNAIRLLLEPSGGNYPDPLAIFRPHLTWKPAKRELLYLDKTINTIGAKDEGSIGLIQGKTFSRVYCDEMTLYPESVIDMIDTRLSYPYSQGYASMNPSHPSHKLKQWIDKAEAGDPDYYSVHFVLDDNPYLDESYKARVRASSSGLFYKRNILGLWCLAEGAVFDFFDRKLHVVKRPPACAEYWVAGIDYGTINSFSCELMGVNTGRSIQGGRKRWFEKEYVWDSKKMGRQKTNSEYADDVQNFLEPYAVKSVYVDPSAAAFKLELRKRGIHVVDANNDVANGLEYMTSELQRGALLICEECTNLIREIEGYVWDPKQAERGYDEPVKKNDHSIDAGRYCFYTHKVSSFDQDAYNRSQEQQLRQQHNWGGSTFR